MTYTAVFYGGPFDNHRLLVDEIMPVIRRPTTVLPEKPTPEEPSKFVTIRLHTYRLMHRRRWDPVSNILEYSYTGAEKYPEEY